MTVPGAPGTVVESGCFPGSNSADASLEGEPLRASGFGVLAPCEPRDVPGGGEGSPEWNGFPTGSRVVGYHTWRHGNTSAHRARPQGEEQGCDPGF